MRYAITIYVLLAVLVMPLSASPTLNGWDTDNIYVIRTETYTDGGAELPQNSIQVLTEALDLNTHNRFGTVLVNSAYHPKSFTFSNSSYPGAHSPAGARMFLADPWEGASGILKDIQIIEYDSNAQRLRRFYLGSAFGTGNGQLVDPNDANSAVFAGCIRYNPKKNTLAFSATLVTNGGNTTKGKVFEFALPDWVADNGVTAMPGTAVRMYEAPAGHTILYNEPITIDFDNDGNMYMTGKTFNANSTGDNFKSDVIKVNTLGLAGGGTTVISITGANAGNLLIEGSVENQPPNPDPNDPAYDSVYTLAVRTVNNSLLLFTRTFEAIDEPTLEYSLTSRAANGNLTFVTTLGANASNEKVYAAQRDYETGAVFNACWRGEGAGGGPKRINFNNTVGVIGWNAYDVVSPPPIPVLPFTPDHDGDGDVDQVDFGFMQTCFTASIGLQDYECRSVDFNQDNVVNTADFNGFLPCLKGADQTPGC